MKLLVYIWTILKILKNVLVNHEEWRNLPEASLLNCCAFLNQDQKIIRIDLHCISDDPKKDTCLAPKSIEQIISTLLKKYPSIKHFDLTTDTTSKEFKAVSVFFRIAKIVKKYKVSILMATFGPGHGKFLIDPSGKIWRCEYDRNCVGKIGVKAANMSEVANYFNTFFSKPKHSCSKISERITLETPSVLHTLSQWESLPETTRHFCYLFLPSQPNKVYQRRYPCGTCNHCTSRQFLQCLDEYCGKWNGPFKFKKKKK